MVSFSEIKLCLVFAHLFISLVSVKVMDVPVWKELATCDS